MNLGTRGTGDEEIQEMNQQQLQLLELAKEFYDSKPLYGETTFEMFLKNCPDALTHLFDLCLIKPMLEQVTLIFLGGDLKLFGYNIHTADLSILSIISMHCLYLPIAITSYPQLPIITYTYQHLSSVIKQ